MKTNKGWDKKIIIAISGILLIYGFACVFLYYQQTLHIEGNPYQSDLPYHIDMAIKDGWFYSLTGILYQLFYMTPFGNIITAIFLAMITIGTIAATHLLLKELMPNGCGKSFFLLIAFMVNIAMPFFIENAHYQRYIGYQSPTIWHNSTYTCMKIGGVIALLLYFRIEKVYTTQIKVKDWMFFSITLLLTTFVKPNFLFVFAPVMACYLCWDWLVNKVKFQKVFLFGLAVVPSLMIILWQNLTLFGENTGNGIEINFGYILTLRSLNPKLTLLLSIAFPLFVLLFTIPQLWKDKKYLFSWLVWGVGLVQVTLFAETGERAKGANFMWSYSFAIFFIMVMCVIKYLEIIKERKGIAKNQIGRYGFAICGGGIFTYQVYCGIVFFINLLEGTTYWM